MDCPTGPFGVLFDNNDFDLVLGFLLLIILLWSRSFSLYNFSAPHFFSRLLYSLTVFS